MKVNKGYNPHNCQLPRTYARDGTHKEFADVCASISATVQTQQALRATGIDKSTTAQALDEFKKEIFGIINNMCVHSSQSNTQVSIAISEKGFQKMMNVPEYKDLMLRTIQRDLNGAYPLAAAPSYSVITIDDDGEYSATAMGASYGALFSANSSKSFWEKNKKDSSSSYDEYIRRKAQANIELHKEQ